MALCGFLPCKRWQNCWDVYSSPVCNGKKGWRKGHEGQGLSQHSGRNCSEERTSAAFHTFTRESATPASDDVYATRTKSDYWDNRNTVMFIKCSRERWHYQHMVAVPDVVAPCPLKHPFTVYILAGEITANPFTVQIHFLRLGPWW